MSLFCEELQISLGISLRCYEEGRAADLQLLDGQGGLESSLGMCVGGGDEDTDEWHSESAASQRLSVTAGNIKFSASVLDQAGRYRRGRLAIGSLSDYSYLVRIYR